MARLLAMRVGILAILGVGSAVFFFFKEVPSNGGFLRFPTVMAFHVIPGAVYPLLVILGTDDVEVIRRLVIITFTAGFLINCGSAELWIRHTRRSETPRSERDGSASTRAGPRERFSTAP